MRKNIRTIKYLILITTLVLLGILLVYTQPQTGLLPISSNYADAFYDADTEYVDIEDNIDSKKPAELLDKTVTKVPNFVGEDKNSKLWRLKASQAVQVGSLSEGSTSLSDVTANTLSADNKKIDYFADYGKYIALEDKVLLKGNVMLKSKNLNAKTEELEYNLSTGFGETHARVFMENQYGELEGDKMLSYENTKRIILKGNVKAKLNVKND